MRNNFLKGFSKFLVKYSRIVILILVFAFFAIFTDKFWSITRWSNVVNILLQQVPTLMLMTVAMIISILLNGIDLSIGSAVALNSCLVAMVLKNTYNAPLGIAFGLLMGVVVGIFNGVLIAKVKVPGFISTYTLQWVLKGIALVLMAGKMIYDFGPDFRPIFTGTRYNFIIYSGVIVAVLMFVFGCTVFGRQVYAVGKNETAARISGINVDRIIIICYIISGVLVSIAGMMYIANLGSAEPAIGSDFVMQALAAALIGGTTFGGARGKIFDAFIGSCIMLILTNGMVMLGIPSTAQDFVVGITIIIAIILERGLEILDQKVNKAEV